MELSEVSELIVSLPDYPVAGVTFKDLTPIFGNGPAFARVIDELAEQANGATVVAGIEARGFILGAALANRLGVGFVPIRKKGKLPQATYSASYDLEYGSDTIEIHRTSVQSQDRVLLIDDVLATGGTASAAIDVLTQAGAQVVGLSVLLELSFLSGRERILTAQPDLTIATIFSE